MINKSVAQFAAVKYSSGPEQEDVSPASPTSPCSPLPSSLCWWRCRWAGRPPSHRCRGGCGSRVLSSAQSWHIPPAGRGIQTSSPSLFHPWKRPTFLKEPHVNIRSHLSSFSRHLTFPFSLGGRRPVNLGFQRQTVSETTGLIWDSRGGADSTHYERLLVDVVHVQSDQVLPAAQVQPPLVLVHQEDAVVAGVEGETEGSRCFCICQLCVDKRGFSPGRLKQQREQRSELVLFFLCLTSFAADLDKLLLVLWTKVFSLLKMCVTD